MIDRTADFSKRIFGALTTDMSLRRNNALAAARTSFGQAARQTTEDLQGSKVMLSGIAYYMSSI
jgi:hypothetical protein